MAEYDDDLQKKLDQAAKLVNVGGMYVHYKGPDKIYKVIDLAIIESDLSVAVIYEPQYKTKKMRFIRPLDNWLEEVEFEGTRLLRFRPITDKTNKL